MKGREEVAFTHCIPTWPRAEGNEMTHSEESLSALLWVDSGVSRLGLVSFGLEGGLRGGDAACEQPWGRSKRVGLAEGCPSYVCHGG